MSGVPVGHGGVQVGYDGDMGGIRVVSSVCKHSPSQ